MFPASAYHNYIYYIMVAGTIRVTTLGQKSFPISYYPYLQ